MYTYVIPFFHNGSGHKKDKYVHMYCYIVSDGATAQVATPRSMLSSPRNSICSLACFCFLVAISETISFLLKSTVNLCSTSSCLESLDQLGSRFCLLSKQYFAPSKKKKNRISKDNFVLVHDHIEFFVLCKVKKDSFVLNQLENRGH